MKKPENKEIIVSSRVRLARNLSGLPFPSRLKDDRAHKIAYDVYSALGGENSPFRLYYVGAEDVTDMVVLKEKHLISDDLLHNQKYGGVILNESDTVSVMVCEEDHIRIQCILAGDHAQEAYSMASEIDDALLKRLPVAFDQNLGFLTACPTNVGTGMRLSSMMFLPGISMTGQMPTLVSSLLRVNMMARGVYGEGSDANGFLYQISNQHTLGLSEQSILSEVEGAVNRIVDHEIDARKRLLSSKPIELRDEIQRSLGLLLHAYTLTSAEFMRAIALVKLGIYYDFITLPQKGISKFERLIINARPASLQTITNNDLSDDGARDIFRATYVGKVLREIGVK